jgi:murein tripeptide amidase MpaA
MKLSILSLALLGLALSATSTRVRYDNYKVYRFTPQTEEQREILLTLQDQNPGVTFWKGVRHVGQPVDIMFPPHLQNEMLESLLSQGMSSSEFIENVQTLVDEEQKAMDKASASPSPKLEWNVYHSTAEVHQFLDQQAAAHPGVATITSAGQSYEGRDLKIIKIARGPSPKPAIWLDANIHAREWITNAVATYTINQLLNSNDAAIQALTRDFDWYIMPIMNPDGYEYTRSTDRMWRKTRAPTPSPLGCRGADPNRNWAFHWMEGGASNNPCSDTYGGSSAFSEVETERSAAFIDNIADDIVLYLSLHSYSQLILLPYGHNNNRYPDYAEYMRIGAATAAAIRRRHGTAFQHGNIVDLLYVASGGSMDYVKGNHDTALTLTFELRDTGRYGFVLPPAQIIPSGEEFVDGLVVMVDEVRNKLSTPSILPIVNPGNKLPVIKPAVEAVGKPTIQVSGIPSIHPIVTPGNKLPVIKPAIEAVGKPTIQVSGGAPSILPIVKPGNKLPILKPGSGPSILPIVNPGNKLPVIKPAVEAVGKPTIEVVDSASLLPIVNPGNKLPVIKPAIEAVGKPTIQVSGAPSILPIVNPGNKLPVIKPAVEAVGKPTVEVVDSASLLPVVRPGNKLPIGVGKPIIFRK